mmetsp:Transcript_42068/g.64485  ORF Transcript_42068/g.64485 Transcript_42068/m.64485 type:complete len:110 (+) Transcript_42068:3242-3571(+)
MVIIDTLNNVFGLSKPKIYPGNVRFNRLMGGFERIFAIHTMAKSTILELDRRVTRLNGRRRKRESMTEGVGAYYFEELSKALKPELKKEDSSLKKEPTIFSNNQAGAFD